MSATWQEASATGWVPLDTWAWVVSRTLTYHAPCPAQTYIPVPYGEMPRLQITGGFCSQSLSACLAVRRVETTTLVDGPVDPTSFGKWIRNISLLRRVMSMEPGASAGERFYICPEPAAACLSGGALLLCTACFTGHLAGAPHLDEQPQDAAARTFDGPGCSVPRSESDTVAVHTETIPLDP